MLEASIMQTVFDIAFAQVPDESTTRIIRLRLRVGALAGVVPEALAFAFEAMKPDTPAAHAELEIERVPARLVSGFGLDGSGQPIPTCTWIDRLAPKAWGVV